MSPTSRPRHSVAVLAALAIAVLGLSVIPAAAANAYSSTSSRGKLLAFVNSERANDTATAWTQTSQLDKWAQDIATSVAACKGCSTYSVPAYTPAPIDHEYVVTAKSSSSAGRLAKIETTIDTLAEYASVDKWGSVGYATHGTTGYAVIVGWEIGSTDQPFSSFSSGKPTIHGKQRVGSTLSVTVPTLTPAATSTGYEWTVTHGATTTDVGSDSTYIPSASDLDGKIGVIVTEFRTGFAAFDFLAHTSKITHGKFGTAKLIHGGIRAVGQSIEFSVTVSPSPDSYTYTWYRNGKKFDNVGNEYTFTDADKGKKIDVKVVIGKAGFTSVTLQTHTSEKVVSD